MKTLFTSALAAAFAFLPALLPGRIAATPQNAPSEPWTTAQVLHPADLTRELADTKNQNPPTILYVGFRTLYEGGHIPGALFFGSASSPQGIAEIKKWAEKLPRTANLVIYCGCCPFSRCPNVRPAAAALRDMGFTRLRVLVLPNDFATDWIARGYPVKKGF